MDQPTSQTTNQSINRQKLHFQLMNDGYLDIFLEHV